MAGRASVELKGKELGLDLGKTPEVVSAVVNRVKDLEAQGWSFEAADASFELLVREQQGADRKFAVESWRTIVEQREDGKVVSEATVTVNANGERLVSTGEGNGPVNALDNALRNAISQLFPELGRLELTDYKVRILEGIILRIKETTTLATESTTRTDSAITTAGAITTARAFAYTHQTLPKNKE